MKCSLLKQLMIVVMRVFKYTLHLVVDKSHRLRVVTWTLNIFTCNSNTATSKTRHAQVHEYRINGIS
jgi:hypothetical protein